MSSRTRATDSTRASDATRPPRAKDVVVEPKVEVKDAVRSRRPPAATETKVKTQPKTLRSPSPTPTPAPETRAKKTTKPIDPVKAAKQLEDRRKKFIDNFATHANANRQAMTFSKIDDPKQPLTNGGMKKRLTDNHNIIYSRDLGCTGTLEQFDSLMREANVRKYIIDVGLTDAAVRENFITFENYNDRKDETTDSTKFRQTKIQQDLDLYIRRVKEHFATAKTSSSQSANEKIIASFTEYTTKGKVYDVSNWQTAGDKPHGYKTIDRPSAASKKKVLRDYPICSSIPQHVVEFLEFLHLPTDTAHIYV